MHGSGLYRWLHATVGEPARHVLLYASLVGVCAAVVTVGRWSRTRGAGVARRVDRAWAVVLFGTWAVMVAGHLRPGRISWDQSLPLHICQLIALAAPVAVLSRRRLPRAIVYFWGLGLNSQAFFHVDSLGGLTHPATYILWGYHEANLAAVAYAVLVRRYRPSWGDWGLNVACIAAYAVVVGSIDAALAANYGMIGPPTVYAVVTAFGPWPARVVWLALTAVAVTAGLTLVWPRNWTTRTPVKRGLPAAA